MRKYIPNLFTSLNLCCGCIGAIAIVLGRPVEAAVFVLLGIFFDFFDGLLARALKVTSEVGVQLDSLADVITSGLVPSLIMMHLFTQAAYNITISEYFTLLFYEFPPDLDHKWLPLVSLLIVVGAAYRLAKFNVDPEQKEGFIGLPTPANAIFILSLGVIQQLNEPLWAVQLLDNVWVLLLITIISSLIMNARIHLFSLKFKSFDLNQNGIIYLFLLLSLVALLVYKIVAVPFIIIGYILFSIIHNATIKN